MVPVDSDSPPEGLGTGTMMEKKKEKKKEKQKKKKRSGSPKRSAAMKALEDTSAGMLRATHGQLVKQALAVSEGGRKDKKEKEEKPMNVLAKLLTHTLKSSGSEKEKQGDKKKKKKKKKCGPSDPTLSSGTTSSSENSSDMSLGEKRDSSSEDEVEAPLRKKAKNRPGSVSLPNKDGGSVVDGKSSSRRSWQVQWPSRGRCTMDLLRQGKLSGLGDALAARFLCLHQSVLDQFARHMELYPLEEASAAGTSLILRTRRHAKLAAKAQGLDWGNYRGGYGRGRGGKCHYDAAGGEGGDHKGKKGKGKGKKGGKNQWWNNHDKGKGDDWKEKPDGKQDK